MQAHTEGLVERAFAIADQYMIDVLTSHGIPAGGPESDPLRILVVREDSSPASSIDDADPLFREAFEWLSDRGMAVKQASGEQIWVELRG